MKSAQLMCLLVFFFFQAEDGIRDYKVTGVQTCALPILTPTPLDVAKNPKKLKFKELEAPLLPRALADVDLALINTNYAIEAKLNPTKDALFIEGADSPYTNIVVSRQDRANDPNIAKLMNALHTPDVKKFILEKYKGAVVPAF